MKKISLIELSDVFDNYLVELFEECYEVKEIKEIIDNPSNFSQTEIIRKFENAKYSTPDFYDYLNTIKSLYSNYEIETEEEKKEVLKRLNSFYHDFIKETMFSLLNIDLNDFEKGKAYIFNTEDFHSNVSPRIVIFEEISSDYLDNLNECKVFDTQSNSTITIAINNLYPFDLDTFKSLTKEWNIKRVTEELKGLTA